MRRSRRAQRKGEVVEDREMRIERILLEHEGDVARGRRRARSCRAADQDRPASGRFEPGNEPQRRRLAGAGRPEQHDELAVGDRQATSRRPPATSLKRLRDALEDDLSHGRPRRIVQRAVRARGRSPRSKIDSFFGRGASGHVVRARRHGHVGGHPRTAPSPASVLTVTICVVPRYSMPKTSPRSGAVVGKRDVLGPHARARSRPRRLSRATRASRLRAADQDDVRSRRLLARRERDEVHRRRADEIGDEQRGRPVVDLLRRARTARSTPLFITAILSAIAMASSWSCVT